MASDRTRVIAIFAAVGVIAGGAGFWFVKIYRPNQVRKDAQAEILAWETRWAQARDCLLGPSPGSSRTGEALAIREMSPDPWNRGSCTSLISKLNRGDAPDSGLPAVEHAWNDLDAAAAKAATAFATHVAESTTLEHDPLPEALDDLDTARAKLREAAELPPAAGKGKPLPAAQILELADGKEPLHELIVESVPSSQALVLFGKTDTHTVQVSLVPGKPPQIGRVGLGAVRALPDGAWGARATETGAQVGAFDVEGAMAQPTPVAMKGGPSVAAVGGTLQDGVVALGTDNQLELAHVTPAGVTAEPPIRGDSASLATDGDGTVAVMWTDKGATHAKLYAPGTPGQEVPIDPDAALPVCISSRRVMTAHATSSLLGCTPEGSLERAGGVPQAFVLCTKTCRKTQLPAGAPTASTTTIVDGKLVAIAEHGGVLGVWHEDGSKTFFALPTPAHPVMAHEWPAMATTDGKVIDVLARPGKGFAIVRIPAR
ncbi:MAG: hypothetical protein ACM31C_28930 [Acidobacteriota bacterium]